MGKREVGNDLMVYLFQATPSMIELVKNATSQLNFNTQLVLPRGSVLKFRSHTILRL